MDGKEGETTEETEMKERRGQEAAEQEGEEETTIDDERMRTALLESIRSDPLFVRPIDDIDITEGAGGIVPNVENDMDTIQRSMIHDKKQFLEDGVGITINENDGDSTREIFRDLRIVRSTKTNKINGATYKGKKILFIGKGGKMKYSTAKDNEPLVKKFKALLVEGDIEHQGTVAAMLEKNLGVSVTQETTDSIIEGASDKIRLKIDSIVLDMMRYQETN